MKFGRFEIPPVLGSKKEEDPQPAFERAPQPAPLDVDELMTLAAMNHEDEVIDTLDAYVKGWEDYASDRNVYVNKGTAPMWAAVRQAGKLVQAFQSEYGRDVTKERLRTVFASLNSVLPEAVIERVTAQQDRVGEATAQAQEHRTGEARKGLHEAVSEVESLKGDTTLSMMDTLKRQASENPEQFLAPEGWLKENGAVHEPEPESEPKPELEVTADREAPTEAPQEEELSLTPDMEVKEPEPVTQDDTLELTPEMRATKQDEARERVAPQQEAMGEAESAYFDAYRKYYKKVGAREDKEPESLRELAQAYNESRFAYRDALDSSAFDRIQEKVRQGSLDAERGKLLLERYNSIITYKEVIKPAAERRYQERLEAKGESAVGRFKQGLAWLTRKNTEANRWLEEKVGNKGLARFARAAGTTAVIGGGAAALGAFGTATLLGAAGWGTYRIGRSLISSAIGASAGELLAKAYESTIGAKRQQKRIEDRDAANELLAEQDEVGRQWGAFSTIDDLERYDREKAQLLEAADERNLEKLEQEKMLVRTLTALGLGAFSSGILSELPSATASVPESVVPASQVAHAPVPDHTPVATPEPHAAPIAQPHAPEAPHTTPTVEHHAAPAHHPHPAETAVKAAPVTAAVASEAPPSPVAVAAPEPEAPASTYDGPFKQVIPLPEGMDPDSPEAVAYLNRAYNPEVFAHEGAAPAPVEAASEPLAPPEAVPETSAEPAAPEPTVAEPAPHEPVTTDPVQHEAPSPEPVQSESVTPDVETAPSPEPAAVPDHVSAAPEATGGEAPDGTVSPEAPDADTSSVEGAFQNANGVEIHPKEVHIYEVKGVKDGGVLWGGTPDERSAFVQEFFDNPENRAMTLYVPFANPANPGGPLEMIALKSDTNGVLQGYPLPGGKKKILSFTGTDLFTGTIF